MINQDRTPLNNSDALVDHSKTKTSPMTCIKKRGQAPVWGWFEKVMLVTGEKPTHAKCTICGAKVSIMNSATTPMINHMKRHHAEIFEKEISQKLREKKVLSKKENSQLDVTIEDECDAFSHDEEITSNHKIETHIEAPEFVDTPDLQESNILELIKESVMEKYASLSVHHALSPDGVPFIHIWKPISKLAGFQGMPFLPCFHIIGTVVVSEPEKECTNEPGDCSKTVLFQLHSFHGKVLADEYVKFQNISTLNTQLVTKMANDQLQMCKGVEEMDREKFVQFIRACKLPSIIAKVRSVCLIEQLMGCVVLRSRLCKFILFEDQPRDPSNLTRCDECDAFECHSDMWMEEITQQDRTRSKYSNNTFERVFLQTSAADMEEMAVFQKVQQMYEQRDAKLGASKKQEVEKVGHHNQFRIENIKAEPGESTADENDLTHIGKKCKTLL